MNFPNFLIIGAAKSGTSTLYSHLAKHPEIFMAPIKEPHFFAFSHEVLDTHVNSRPVHDWVRSKEEYLQLFADCGDVKMAGECSISSLYWPGTANRIQHFNANMKLIVSLRDPVDRAYSSFNYAKSYGIESLMTLSEGLQAEEERIQQERSLLLRYRDLGLYAEQLSRYYDVFPSAQIKVILYDDLVSHPIRTVKSLFEFLGVSTQVELDPHLRKNVTKRPDDENPFHRFISGEHAARATVRKLLPLNARQRLREAVRDVLYGLPPQLETHERLRAQELFRDDTERLTQLLGRDLTAWLE